MQPRVSSQVGEAGLARTQRYAQQKSEIGSVDCGVLASDKAEQDEEQREGERSCGARKSLTLDTFSARRELNPAFGPLQQVSFRRVSRSSLLRLNFDRTSLPPSPNLIAPSKRHFSRSIQVSESIRSSISPHQTSFASFNISSQCTKRPSSQSYLKL